MIKEDYMTLRCVFVLAISLTTLLILTDAPVAFGQMPTNFPSEGNPQKAASNANAPYRLTGRFHLQKSTNKGYLVLQCELPKDSYVYSLTQKGQVRPSVIKVTPSDAFLTSGKFIPDRQPIVIENDPVFEQRIEKHTGKVQFFIPLQIQSGFDQESLQPELIFDGQVCSDKGVCMPIRNKSVKAKFAGYFERTAEKTLRPQNTQRQ